MIEYKTPSSAVFRSRQQFHTMQKFESENISSWLQRLQTIVRLCDFEQLTDFMFIDKFVSGLSDLDFKKVSHFPTWTVEKLKLVANDDNHSTENIDVQPNPDTADTNEILSVYIKCEVDIDDSCVDNLEINSNDYPHIKHIHTNDPDELVNEVSNLESDQAPTKKKKCMSNRERGRRFTEKLKQTGQYEEYKRKRNEIKRNKRLSRQNEGHLPLESLNERRRKNGEIDQRYRNKRKVRQVANSIHDENAENSIAMEVEKRPKSERRKAIKQCDKARVYQCYLCLMCFDKSKELKIHLTIEHQQTKRPVLQCSYCPKTTSSREILTHHVNKFHSDSVNVNASQKLHKCPCCDKEFTWRAELNEHLALHPDYKPFICETCASSFKCLKDLKSHQRKHYKEKPFKCDRCDMQFIWNSSFRDHLLMHRGEKPYPCKICKKYFRQLSHLKRHLVAVHNPEAKPHVCSTCGKRYVDLCQLKVHLRNHTGDKPYQCDQCDRGFSQASSLKTHLAIHAAKAHAKHSLKDHK